VVRLAKDACRHVHPVHLIGERGVGKYELGARIARGWESELVSIDCRGLDGAPCDVRDGLSQALAQGSSVLLRSAEMLPVGTARVVESVLQQYESPPIIMTMRRPTSTTTRLIAMLSSTEIVVPPLRTRPEDIPPLVRHFADEAGAKRPSASLLHILTQADWPGNTVQLRSVVAQTAMSATTQELTVDDLPQGFRHGMITGRLSRLEEAELHELRNALHEAGGNRKKAADILQIGRSTIYRRMDYYRRRGMVL
jgi:sigma-54 dependent transcriptional regulator, acetoin dehydrogenase operon transcriptional activator AcoR